MNPRREAELSREPQNGDKFAPDPKDGGKVHRHDNPVELPTLRDQFAMRALPVCMAIVAEQVKANGVVAPVADVAKIVADDAYSFADAMMLAQRKL